MSLTATLAWSERGQTETTSESAISSLRPQYPGSRRSLRPRGFQASHPDHPTVALGRMVMNNPTNTNATMVTREPWNKGKLIGQKPPLRPKHVWSIRTKLQIDQRMRDLAMFNLAIDSELRG